MKSIRKVLAIVCALSLLAVSLTGCSSTKLKTAKVSPQNESDSDKEFDEVTDNIIIENDRLRFEMDAETTHFSITDKISGKRYYSISDEMQSVDDNEQFRMKSEVKVRYYEQQSDAMYMYSDPDSVQNGNFKILLNDKTVRVYYSMGFVDELVPLVLDKGTFDSLMEKLGNDGLRRRFERYFDLYSSEDKLDDFEEKAKKYPILKNKDLYILSDSVSDVDMSDIADYISQTDFTKDDYIKMLDKLGIEFESGNDSAGFMIPIEYSLTNDGFSVKLLTDKIEESSDKYKLQSVDILEYFASVTDSNGYFLIPDGSGAIIPFAQNGGELSIPYYGDNYTKNLGSVSTFTKNLSLPVFGISLADGGIFAVIKNGAAASSLNLSLISEASTCNHIFASFEIRAIDSTDYGANMQIPIYNLFANEKVASAFEVQYHLLTTETNNYNSMAEIYRTYITGINDKVCDKSPIYVDYLCMITEKASMMGVPYTKKVVLSTIEEIYDSVEKLIDSNVGPVIVRLFGYGSNGAEHSAYSKIQIDRKVGTVSQVIKLKNLLEDNGGTLYFDADMQFAYKNGNGFSASKNSARYLNRLVVARGEHDIVSRDYASDNQLRYLISPLYYSSISENMMSSIDEKIGKVGLSYGSTGTYLGGDYAKGRNLDRCESEQLTVDALKKAQESGFEMAFDGGNAFVLPFASHLFKIPSNNSKHKLEENAVPFYQTVIHGSISYAGAPYNMSENIRESVCDTYAFGSAPYAVFITKSDELIANTAYETKWYSIDDKDRLESFIKLAYNTYDLRQKTASSRIIEYTELGDGISLTVYDNGIKVYVNRNSSDCTYDNVVIPAYGFEVRGNESA